MRPHSRILICDDRRSSLLSALLSGAASFSAAVAAPKPTDQASFRASDAGADLKVDAAAGRIDRVSLITADREATGWFMWVDDRTVALFGELMADRKVKAYATHRYGDGTLDECGLWSATKVDGKSLRASFEALNAWRSRDKGSFDTLFELAEKAPAEFGVSLNFRYRLAWVTKGGADVPTKIVGWSYDTNSPRFEPSAPSDAVRFDMPSVRPVKVMSADFVDEPAANSGLFAAMQVDAHAQGNPPSAIPPASTMDIKTLHAEFGTKPAQLARAVALFSANDKITLAEIKATIGNEEVNADLARFRQSDERLTVINVALEKAGFKAAGDKSPLDVLLGEHADFKSKVVAADAAISALKAAGFEAKDGKSAVEFAIAAHAKLKTDVATLRNGGSAPVETGSPAGDGSKAVAQLSGLARARAALAAKAAKQNAAAN